MSKVCQNSEPESPKLFPIVMTQGTDEVEAMSQMTKTENVGSKYVKQAVSLFMAIGALSILTTGEAKANFGSQRYAPKQQAVGANVQRMASQVQIAVNAPQTASASSNALPPTTLDSFVRNAGGNAEAIYGDEGTTSIPPYLGFSYSHRINAGITGQRDAGLTTGHGSYLPSTWGADEFLAAPGEQSQAGANGGNPRLNNADAALNTADQTEGMPADPSTDPNVLKNLPPSPGPGYQPIFQHGVFVGYLSPALNDLMQTDPAAAWTAFANSSDFTGPEGLRLSLLMETGAITPDQQAALNSMALFGL